MTGPIDVVDRADSLMRRRRSFVATPTPAPPAIDAAGPPPENGEDDDLPVLTEVLPAEAAIFSGQSDRFDETQVSLLAADIAHAIGQQLSSELPTLIETALLAAGEQLRAGIDGALESALRDFIARRRQLRLPLDEPGDSA